MRMLTSSDLFNEMDRFFGETTRRAAAYDERSFIPACEVAETDANYLMSLDLPGMKKENIKIEVVDKLLTISGERKREAKSEEKEKVQRFEKSYGFFKRSFTLPTTVDTSKVEARYEDGVLELSLPKAAAIQPRAIEIK